LIIEIIVNELCATTGTTGIGFSNWIVATIIASEEVLIIYDSAITIIGS
jgi:hypothetical protein